MKDILYLEVDEDITSAIDKLTRHEGKNLQVVVPKRSTLLQSIINQRLLKKAAKEAGKDLVLVTTDRTSLSLAARVGLPVAEKVGGDAVLTKATSPEPDTAAEVVEDEAEEPAKASLEQAKELAAASKASPLITTIPVADNPVAEPVAKGKKGAKVPDFNALQKKLLLAGLAVLVLGCLWLASWWWSKATVTMFARGTKITAEFDFTVDPAARTSEPEKALLAGQKIEALREVAGNFTPTGKKDIGTKASGSVTVTNYCYNPGTIAAGTIFTASDGKKFVSTEAKAVPNAVPAGGACPNPTTAAVPIEASANGGEYNLAPTSYSVGSIPSSGNNNSVRGQGEQLSGGTTKVITVVAQADIDKTKDELLEKDKEAGRKALTEKAGSGIKVFDESLAVNVTEIVSSPAVGEEAASPASLIVKVTYGLLAASDSDFKALVRAQEQKQIGNDNQIYDDGIASAQIKAGKTGVGGRQDFHFITDAFGGAKIDLDALAQQLRRKKYGDAVDIAAKQPGIERAEASIWPGWASKMPPRANRIKIDIKISGAPSD